MKKTFLLGIVVGALALNTFGLFASEGEATIPTDNNFYNRCSIACPKEEPCIGDCSQDVECVESGCNQGGCGIEGNNNDCRQGNRLQNGQMRRRGC
ncbi:MAG: hypothetical protein RR448_09010, partial [Niameybacter sp.]|uniref:hypothetical protein n=1 Tax=Niameybacter sp. TaxID=2033640 RepID=UPI002FC80154